jgi:RNA 3'-terminal phosphate cyclase
VLARPEPADDGKNDVHNAHAVRGLWHFARGPAFVGKRQFDRAQEELKELQAESALAPEVPRFGVAVFTQNLRLSPDDPRALLGLAAALSAQEKKADAAATRARFESVRRFADVPSRSA